MLEIIRYNPNLKKDWDEFVLKSDIPIFMFMRDYMDYHKDRFNDFSLLIYKRNKLIALFPGHIIDCTFYSHSGLTFGGLITGCNFGFTQTKNTFNSINKHLTTLGISNISLKLQPSIYSLTHAQSQLYLLQSCLTTHSDLKLGACIYTKNHQFPKSTVEKRKLKLYQFELGYSDDFSTFWNILEKNLMQQHNTKPVHSLEEILYLKEKFPNSIKLYVAKNKDTGNIDSGAVLYKFNNTLKLQYQAASSDGRKNRASHALYYSFIKEHINNVDFIDLGNCMEGINEINENLLYLKERFGATVYLMHSYEYKTSYEF